VERGTERVVAIGDHSHKCPVYVRRVPPCTAACPAGEDIRGYHNILRGLRKSEDPMADAWRLITEVNPFPAVMGRVCPAPCQSTCNRQYVDETIGINAVEHAIGEYAIQKGLSFEKPSVSTGKRIAVVGSGPAGLSCAYQLARRGHHVTVFEAFEKLGGMMRYGIANYRVSREALDAEIQRILDLGIEVRTHTKIGADLSLEDLRKQYDAVFLGLGAQKGRDLPVPGIDASNVLNALDFLIAFNKGDEVQVGRKVVAIGDGDVAMDVVRLALRLGAKDVVLLSGVAREEMKASPSEFIDAVAEGTRVELQVGTLEVLKDAEGRATGIKCVRMEKKVKGEEGWNSPVPFLRYKPVAGTEFEVAADTIVAAIGQATDMTGMEGVGNGKPWVQVDQNYQVKGMPGVFSGGDVLSLTLLTTAIGHGRKAAEAIDAYVRGEDLPKPVRDDIIPFKELASTYFLPTPQKKRTHRHPEKVIGDFNEILESLDHETAKQESKRCMSCGLCFECDQCMIYCPQEAIKKFPKNPMGDVMFTVYTRCVGCHICAEVCPTGYIDMAMGEDL
jgi:NADPH-dependent glutamate synthase beta subunit-like oxidoreductase